MPVSKLHAPKYESTRIYSYKFLTYQFHKGGKHIAIYNAHRLNRNWSLVGAATCN